ncbi:MAG: 4'-phosphopantetheinyl transferase family protein [Solirubrobacteraceae bacterium]
MLKDNGSHGQSPTPAYALLNVAGADQSRAWGAVARQLARAHPQASAAPFASRSYALPMALVAWHSAPVGVDIERISPCERSFAQSICTPEELDLFRSVLHDSAFVTSLWSSKEALAKALGDAVAYDPRRLASPLCWESGACGSWAATQLPPPRGHVAWLVWSLTERPDRAGWVN